MLVQKKSPTYYVQKSVRIGNRTTTKTVERLGSIEELKARCGDEDLLEWAKDYVKKLTLSEKEAKQGVLLKHSATQLIAKNARCSCNAGYLFIQDIYYSLSLDKICSAISEKYKFEYDLNDIMTMLVYSRIISPSSKKSSLHDSQDFLEQSKCDLHQIYRALEALSKENDFFQSELYKNSQSVIDRKRRSSTTTAPTTILRLRKRMISGNYPKTKGLPSGILSIRRRMLSARR